MRTGEGIIHRVAVEACCCGWMPTETYFAARINSPCFGVFRHQVPSLGGRGFRVICVGGAVGAQPLPRSHRYPSSRTCLLDAAPLPPGTTRTSRAWKDAQADEAATSRERPRRRRNDQSWHQALPQEANRGRPPRSRPAAVACSHAGRVAAPISSSQCCACYGAARITGVRDAANNSC